MPLDCKVTIERGTHLVPPADRYVYSRAWCDKHHWIATNEKLNPDQVKLIAIMHVLGIEQNNEGDNPLNPDGR